MRCRCFGAHVCPPSNRNSGRRADRVPPDTWPLWQPSLGRRAARFRTRGLTTRPCQRTGSISRPFSSPDAACERSTRPASSRGPRCRPNARGDKTGQSGPSARRGQQASDCLIAKTLRNLVPEEGIEPTLPSVTPPQQLRSCALAPRDLLQPGRAGFIRLRCALLCRRQILQVPENVNCACVKLLAGGIPFRRACATSL